MSHAARLRSYGDVSTTLALYGDSRLRRLVDAAVPIGSGIGGVSALMDVAGVPVFVKRVRLTDLETRPENIRSTANLFGLPTICQYGIGGPNFGAWRELAVHTMTTDWVVSGRFSGFPLMYHWRVLPDVARPLHEELADVEKVVAYWGDAPEVRDRIEALRESSASLVLFLEYIPRNLHDWLGEQVSAGGETAERACSLVEDELAAGVSFMNARGLLHFDAHFENILTDGRHLYFADFGLAISTRFDLSPEELDFFDRHRVYDRCYTSTYLVHWLTVALYGNDREDTRARIRAWAAGEPPTGLPGALAEILTRHSPLADVLADFYSRLQTEDRNTPYPLTEIRRVAALHGLSLEA
ncbi:hypothetical protein Misp01_03460 [Microtetraspora sp. NBRC 13810]|nr:hypothetical protein Misp01_03460 [Microtetraspora sp. NBRC 13810]